MAKGTTPLNILLCVLTGLIIITSVVMAKIPKPEPRIITPGALYHQDVVMLGVRASRFSGMEIHLDSPNVLLNRAEKLQLSEVQQEKLRQIRDQARQEAVTILTPEQQASLPPADAPPFVFDQLNRRIPTCSDCTECSSSATCSVSGACSH